MNWVLERILVGRADRQTISKYAAGADRYLGVVLILAAALLGMALTSRALTASGYMGLDGTYSLLDMLLPLFKGGNGKSAGFIVIIALLIPVLLLSNAFDLWYKLELQGEIFARKAVRLQQYGKLWYLECVAIIFGIYILFSAKDEVILHPAIYYLVISVGLQKLVLTRLGSMINTVKFVEEE